MRDISDESVSTLQGWRHMLSHKTTSFRCRSPDGSVSAARRFVFVVVSEIAYVRGDSLFVLTLGTGASRVIASGGELHSCSWAPDGARLACVSGNHYYVTVGTVFGVGPMFGNLAPSRIVLIPAAGGAAVSVTDGGSLHQSPAWSRDGKTLYFVSNRQGPRDVYAIKVAGMTPPDRDPVRITTGMGAHSIEFSADGARVVYAFRGASRNMFLVPLGGRATSGLQRSRARTERTAQELRSLGVLGSNCIQFLFDRVKALPFCIRRRLTQ